MQHDMTSTASHKPSSSAPAVGDRTSAWPAAPRRISSRAEFARVLRRAGYSTTQAQSVLRGLPDPIDFDRDDQALFERGVTLDRLIDAMGGSP